MDKTILNFESDFVSNAVNYFDTLVIKDELLSGSTLQALYNLKKS